MVRVVSGMRPTGQLHLGHFLGVLQQWIALQEEADCYFFVADWHALTTEYEHPEAIAHHTVEMVRDWLAAGLDPERATIFRQSDVKEHAELHLLLSMVTPLSWLERVPSYKDLIANLADRELRTYGFLGYPLLQTADVLIYKAEQVPVGEDQVAHLELSREVVRRLHHITGTRIFPEPQPRLTRAPKVPGTDGRKMSKSYDNAIYLADETETIAKKVSQMVTDPARVRRSDPGHPEVCDVYALHRLLTPADEVERIAADCRSAAIGCVDCKRRLAARIDETLAPIRARRAEVDAGRVEAILAAGAERARRDARATMREVRGAFGLPTDTPA